MTMHTVQLITYPDSLGGSLAQLNVMLEGPLQDLFRAGVHILPPFPHSGDRGFAPITHTEIDPSHGSWEDIKAIAKNHKVTLDLIVNHISRQSEQFQDFLAKGEHSAYATMFIRPEQLWPGGVIPAEDLAKIFLRRASPFSTYTVGANQEQVQVWTTFGHTDPSEQIDIDINAPITRTYIADIYAHFAAHGVSSVRLDAVGYVTKQAGSDCFFVEPEIFDALQWLNQSAQVHNLSILPEIHAPLRIQKALAERGYWSYDFASPYLILDALVHHDPTPLVAYLAVRPEKMFTMLDCHDGIPVLPDLEGLVSEERMLKTIKHCSDNGALFSRLLDPPADLKVDVHQINCTYYSALGSDEKAYLAARAIQLFLPGIPQVYYVGLLAGENDRPSVETQGDGRAINRKNYSRAEITAALATSVVQEQISLIELRNHHPAFAGSCTIAQEGSNMTIAWQHGEHRCSLNVDFSNYAFTIDTKDTSE